jgi:hemolysin III
MYGQDLTGGGNSVVSIQTPREELANSLTHGIGAALAVAALAILVTMAALRGDGWRVTSLAIYGTTLVVLYLISTLYHAFRGDRIKRLFRMLDHCAIFLLIAGTYTPITLVHLRGGWGWSLFGVIWGLAICGIIAKVFLTGKLRVVSVLLYVAMGWLVLVALDPIIKSVPPGLLAWLIAGGVSYTFGLIFYMANWISYRHAVWHLFVLGGSACHFIGMLVYVAPA